MARELLKFVPSHHYLFEPTGKVSKKRLGALVDALKVFGDVPKEFAVERLFLTGITKVAD